ncbi:M23 family metallopeptidase [Modestobacter roseus]|uniref:M23 family metallopeptidase n=1 Tax=Modestobacter roseus TaxID=1181884 RepID=UPI0034DE263A
MTRLRELVGRTRSVSDADLDTDGAWVGDWTPGPDWDDRWAELDDELAEGDLQDDDGQDHDLPDDAGRDDAGEDDAGDRDPTPSRRFSVPRLRGPRIPAVTRRPPGRRAPVLLAVAVAGALGAALLGGTTDTTPLASGQDYGLGVDEASFAGGVDVAGARGEISQAEAAARLGEIAASRAAREPDFVVPTTGRLTTCYCMRWGTMHWGLDLAAPLGTPIYSAADGVVLRAGPASGYGNALYIQDADGNVHIYGHMRYYDVEAGDVVSAGEQIAKVGNQGQSTGPHLHYEIHVGGMNGKPTDPEAWLAERGLSVR